MRCSRAEGRRRYEKKGEERKRGKERRKKKEKGRKRETVAARTTRARGLAWLCSIILLLYLPHLCSATGEKKKKKRTEREVEREACARMQRHVVYYSPGGIFRARTTPWGRGLREINVSRAIRHGQSPTNPSRSRSHQSRSRW